MARRRLRVALITADHGRAGRLENDPRATGHVVRAVTYGDTGVTLEVALPEAGVDGFRRRLASVTAGAGRRDVRRPAPGVTGGGIRRGGGAFGGYS